MTELNFSVAGTPAPQGSKRHVGNNRMVESSKKVAPWRQDVKHAALLAIAEQDWTMVVGPVHVLVNFYLARPKDHYRANGDLKDWAPDWVTKAPDLDKLCRALLDAMGEAGVYRDDSQVVQITATKRFFGLSGADVKVVALDGLEPRS